MEGKTAAASSTRAAAGQPAETMTSTGTTGMILASSGAPSLLSPGRQSVDDADAGDDLDIGFELEHHHHDIDKGNVVLSNLPSQSEFLRELADLAGNDIRRLLRYTVKNTICLIEGYKDDSEERATRNCEEALSCFFEKLDDYVEFAVRRVEQVCKSGATYGVGGVQSTLTTAILQRQLRRSIDHARELSNNLENAEQKEHDVEKKFREMRKMYYQEVLNLRQRCTRLQRQVLNDLPADADLESVQVDDDVSFWGEKSLVEPWIKDMLVQQASELKARASIAEQKLLMQIERQKDQMESCKQDLGRSESQVSSLKAKVQFARMRLAMASVGGSKRDSTEDILNLDDTDLDMDDTKTQSDWGNTSQSKGGKSPPKINPAVARRKRAENLITEDPAEQFQRVQVLQSAVDEGALKLQSLKQLSSQWDQKLKDLDDEMWKETSSTVLSQIQSRIAKIHDEFVPLQSNGETGELAKVDDKDAKDPWMLATDAEARATKLENEVTLLTLDKQHLQKLLQSEKEEPQKQRKQLRAMNIQMEAKDATIAQNDKFIEAAKKEQEAMQSRIDAMQARLEQLEEQLSSERKKPHAEENNPFSHFLEDEMSAEAASRKNESLLDADNPNAADGSANPDAADEDGHSEPFGEGSDQEETDVNAEGANDQAEDSQQAGMRKPKPKRQVRKFVSKTKSAELEGVLGGDDDMDMENPESSLMQPKKAPSVDEIEEDPETAEEHLQPDASKSPSRASSRPASRLESNSPQDTSVLARRNTNTGTRLRVAMNRGRRRSSGDAEMLKSHLESHEDESLDLLKTPRASEAGAVFTKQVSGSEAASENEGPLGWSATPSGSTSRQTTVPKLVHQRLLKIAVDRERLRWQAMLPRARSTGSLGAVLRGQPRKSVAEGMNQAKTVESMLSAAEEEADFQRHSSLFESSSSARLADRFRSNDKSSIQVLHENNHAYLKVMAMLQNARKAVKDVTEQYSAALFTADASALEAKELQRLFNASEVRGRIGWELQRQCLLKCQKALKRSDSSLKIDPALIARTPGEALEQLSTDMSGAQVNQVQRNLRNTRSKADRVVHQRLEQVTKLAVDDALALVPVQMRLAHDTIDQAFVQTCQSDSDQPKSSASAREIQAQKMAEAKMLAEESEIDLGDLPSTSSPLADAVSSMEAQAAQNRASALRTDLAQMRSQAMNRFRGYQQRAHDLECDATAMRVLGQLRENLAMEAETTASDGGDSYDDEMSSDDEVFSRARHAVWIEVQDDDFELGDRSIFPESNSNQERQIETLRPLAPASEDTLRRCEMPSMHLPVAQWSALPEHLEVGEVEQVSRQRREAVERQSEHRFEKMVNQQAEKERRQHEKAERASSKEESGPPAKLAVFDWTPPRSPTGDQQGKKSILWTKAMNALGQKAEGTEGKECDPEAEADREQKVQALTQSVDNESLELMQLLADGLNEHKAENTGGVRTSAGIVHAGSTIFQDAPKSGDREDTSIYPERSGDAASNTSSRSNLLCAAGPPQKLRRPLSARPAVGPRPASARQGHERMALKRSGSLDLTHQVDASDTKEKHGEDEAPRNSDAVPHKPATIMEKLITVVLKAFKNQTGNNRMQEMMQDISPQMKTSMLSGFVETFVEDRQQQIAKIDGETESDPAMQAQLKAWGVQAPKPIMVDKSFQCTREDRVTLKEHGTQTEAVLSERDESTRRINVREQALKALADRLANLNDLGGGGMLHGLLQDDLARPGHYHHDALVGATHAMPAAPPTMSRSASEGDILACRKSTMPRSLHPDLSGFLPLSPALLGGEQSPRLLSAEHSPRFGAQDLVRGGNPRGNVDRDDVARLAAKALLVPGAEALRSQASGLPGDFTLQGVSLGKANARGKQLVPRGLGGAQSAYNSRRSTVCAPSSGTFDLEDLRGERKKSESGSRIASRKNTEFEFASGTGGVTSFSGLAGSGDPSPDKSPRQLVTRSATQGGILLTPAGSDSLQVSRRNSFHGLGVVSATQSTSASRRASRRESRRASGIGLLSQLPEVTGSSFPDVLEASARRMTQKATKMARPGGSEDAAEKTSAGEIQVFTGNEGPEAGTKEADKENEEDNDSDTDSSSSESSSHSQDASDPGEQSDGEDTPKTLGGGGDLLLDGLLDNLVTEVVDFAQTTDLQWDSLPGRVVTWLKYNLMQRQQGVLYNSSWTTSELDDFPGVSLLDREQLVKDFEFFLFHTMSLERPVRAIDQRRALKKIYRQACVADAIERPAEPERTAAKMPHVESKAPAPAAATMGPPMVIMSMKSMASTTSMTDASTECIDPSLLKWSSTGTLSSGSVTQSQQLNKSRPRLGKTASKPSVASSEYASTLSIDSRGPHVTPAEGDSSANDSDDSRDASDTEDGIAKRLQEDVKNRPTSDFLERPRPAPPPGLSRQQLAEHHLGALLGFDVSATRILDVQQDMYCQHYFRNQEGLARGIGLEPFPGPEEGLTETSQSQFSAAFPPWPETAEPQQQVRHVDVGLVIGPLPFDRQVLAGGQERANTAGPVVAGNSFPIAVAVEQQLRPSTAPETGTVQAQAEALKRARHVRLLAQRLDALRPYHLGPIPPSVVEQLRQLDRADASVSRNFGGLAGTTIEERRRLLECLDPLYQRIRTAVNQSYSPQARQGLRQDAGARASRSAEGEQLSQHLAGDTRDPHRINSTLEGLCRSAASRETIRKALLRFAFRKLRNHSQPSQAAEEKQVNQGFTLRVMAQEDTVGKGTGSNFLDSERPAGATTASRKPPSDAPVQGPPEKDFVGAVAWSYKGEARLSTTPGGGPGRGSGQSLTPRAGSTSASSATTAGTLPRLSKEWQFRPGTAPEVTSGNREPLPEPPPGFELGVAAARPDTAPEAAMPGVHGLSPSSRQGTVGGSGHLIGNPVVGPPASGRPNWRRSAPGRPPQSPRDQVSAVPDRASGGSDVARPLPGAASRQQASDHPAAATPTTKSVFASALGRTPSRRKPGAPDAPGPTPRTGTVRRLANNRDFL